MRGEGSTRTGVDDWWGGNCFLRGELRHIFISAGAKGEGSFTTDISKATLARGPSRRVVVAMSVLRKLVPFRLVSV